MKKIRLYTFHILIFLMAQLVHADTGVTNSITQLEQMAETYHNTPQEPVYWQAILQKAIEINSQSNINKALHGLTTYYYYKKDIEMVNYWAHYTDSLVKARNVNPDVYYDAHRNRIIINLANGDMERSISDIVQIFNQAQNTSQEYGMVCSSELLGTMYQTCHHDSAALIAYQDAHERLKKIGGHLTFQIRLLSYRIEMLLILHNLEDAEVLIAEYDNLLKQREKEDVNKNIKYDEDWYTSILHSFRANLYLHKNQLDKAKKALNEASSFYISDSSLLEFATYYYLYVKANYLNKVNKHKEALATVQLILDKGQELDAMRLKSEILFEIGQFKEAIAMYDQIDKITQDNNNEGLIRQMNSLRALYDKNSQVIQENKVQLNNLQAEENHRFLIYSIIISVALSILSLILLLYLRRSYIFKNALEKEKESLIVLKEKLNIEKQKAEEANRMKNIFVANISHEIRTPLNAIVGFSTLLAEGEIEEEDKPEYINLINKNSGLLLNLVNDVLDLSKMETGNFKLNIGPCELTACCNKALDSVRDKLAEGVALTFNPEISPYILNTDIRHLFQLLTNLLNNAVKFTLNGQIDLTYKVDEAKRQVRFVVTDNGPGIPEDKRDRIFERFEKLDEYSQGTGLGLTICKTIAEQLNGVLCIDPKYTNGARFIFVHPFEISNSANLSTD